MRTRAQAIAMTALILALWTAPAVAAPTPTAPFSGKYQILEATLSEKLSGTGPGLGDSCPSTSGTNDYSAHLGEQPASEQSYVETDPDEVSRGVLGASGTGRLIADVHGCDITVIPPTPCVDSSSSNDVGAGFQLTLEAAKGATDVKVSFPPPWIAFASFGNPACQALPFSLTSYQPGSSTEPVAKFVADTPQTLVLSGQTTGSGGLVSAGAQYTLRVTFRRVSERLEIHTTPAIGIDTSADGKEWPFSFNASWEDEACTDPSSGSIDPLAYAVIGTDRGRLATLLKAPQARLASYAEFGPNAFHLGARANGRKITGQSKSERGTRFQPAASRLHVRNGRRMDVGDGLFYGARIACKTRQGSGYRVETAAPRVLCRNRARLPGEGWSKLTDDMKAKLDQLFALLRGDGVCFGLKQGYRTKDKQQEIHDRWHEIADRPNPADRTQDTLDALCPNGVAGNGPLRGFMQCPTRWNGHGVADNGPSSGGDSRHNAGEAADLKLAFGSKTGKFDPDAAQRKSDIGRFLNSYIARVPGLCPTPVRRDPGHVELPWGQPPACRFTDRPRTRRARAGRAVAAARKPRRVSVSNTDALAAVNAFARAFVERSFMDDYVDWAAGPCRGRGKQLRCKLTVHAEGARRYACRAQVGVRRKGKRLAALVYGRKTRCR